MTRVKSPYLRIADALRQRIDAGELRPGERVPSTRELSRQWGVASATAAHALKTLVDEGVLEAVARVGTVVARVKPDAAPKGPVQLTRSVIVQAAIAIADAEGLSAVSLRGVAAKLDAPVMSLYRHVRSKEELLRAMVDSVLGEARLPRSAPIHWRAQLETSARLQWRTLRRHPWLARQMSVTRPYPSPNAIAHGEWVLRALEGHGLDASLRMNMHIVLHAFIQGIAVNLETEADAVSETGMTDDAWMDTQTEAFAALAASGNYPAFSRVLAELSGGFELDFERLFELGLKTLLDGFAQLFVEGSRKRR